MATGLANAGGALLGAMPGGGGTSQTAVNRLAGARTQLAEIVTAGATLVTMLLLAPLIGLMPHATLAAVVIVYSIGLIKPAEFRTILRVRRTEFIWALAALGGVVLLGTLQGIVVAIVLSLVALAYRDAENPPVTLPATGGATDRKYSDGRTTLTSWRSAACWSRRADAGAWARRGSGPRRVAGRAA